MSRLLALRLASPRLVLVVFLAAVSLRLAASPCPLTLPKKPKRVPRCRLLVPERSPKLWGSPSRRLRTRRRRLLSAVRSVRRPVFPRRPVRRPVFPRRPVRRLVRPRRPVQLALVRVFVAYYRRGGLPVAGRSLCIFSAVLLTLLDST